MTEHESKPIVYYINDVRFDTEMFPGYEVAHVRTLNHYNWGNDKVRTSVVLKKFPDGSFETMNTMYVPYKGNDEQS